MPTHPLGDFCGAAGCALPPDHTAVRDAEPATWRVRRWFNTDTPLDLEDLRGKVVFAHTFQMLCPGCILHGIPQAKRVHALFGSEDLVVVGIHTVFEHHRAMGDVSLEAFLREFDVRFPVGVDLHTGPDDIPWTMNAWRLRGTPSSVLIDRSGRIRLTHLGTGDDLLLGASITRLLAEPRPTT